MIEQIIERLINGVLALDAVSLEKMQPLIGKVIALQISDLDRIIHVLPGKDGVQVRRASEQPADVTISGHFGDYLQGTAASIRSSFQPDAALQVSGDPETAEQLRVVLGSLDLEEALSQVVGDTPARKISTGFRDIAGWLTQAGESIAANLGEVLKEEKHLLVTGPRLERFLNEAARLRESTDRLEQRVDKLERQTSGD
jgi:ubiquinone biosynthesis protein UbiJ